MEDIRAAFPKLEILGLIGQGGMGFVYKARQPDLDRVVALKILAPELSRDPAFAERFAREARTLGKLHHPNIVTVFEHGETGGFFYLLMEYVDGVNLRQAMRAGRFTPEQALAIVPGICDALQAAHGQGIWHRDIKPENILLDREGRVKIADFGIARIIGDPQRDFTLTMTGHALGSATYMAPEQHEKPHEVDHRADIYSLGVVIYEMLTGELPLGRFPLPSERAEVNARIDEIVLRTLEKERELRQQSAEEVKAEVEGVATGTCRNASQESRAPSHAPARSYARLSFVLLLLGVLGTLVLLSLSRRDELALIFGMICTLIALVLAALSWRERLSKATLLLVGLLLLVIAPVQINHQASGTAALRDARERQAELRAAAADARDRGADPTTEIQIPGAEEPDSFPPGRPEAEGDGILKWSFIESPDNGGEPRVKELFGDMGIKSTSGEGLHALNVHIAGRPIAILLARGGIESRIGISPDRVQGQYNLRNLRVVEANRATIDQEAYDLTRGRVFLQLPEGTFQIAMFPERMILDGEALKEFFTGLEPTEAMIKLIEAAKGGDQRLFREGLSQSYKERIRTDPFGDPDLGYFSRLRIIKTEMAGDATAEVLLESPGDPRKRITHQMTHEDGSWKLTEHVL